METTDLMIGQSVSYSMGGNYPMSSYNLKFSQVKSITPSGIVVLGNGHRFNAVGKELKSAENSFPGGFLIETKTALEIVELQKTRDGNKTLLRKTAEKLLGKCRLGDLTDDQTEALHNLMKTL